MLLLEERALLTSYPNVGANPIPLNPIPNAASAAFYRTQESGYYPDGTLVSDPVVDAGKATVAGQAYNLKKLANIQDDFIDFGGNRYVVYSAVPQVMAIDYAYQLTGRYYDQADLDTRAFDFPSTAPRTINDGRPTTYAARPSVSNDTKDYVYVTTPAAGAGLYIPNLPSAGAHDGLTDNVYWTVDPYLDTAGYSPAGPTYHLEPYGWAVDARTVDDSIYIYDLDSDGLTSSGTTFLPPNPTAPPHQTPPPAINPTKPFNTWLHLIQGHDANKNAWWPLLHPAIANVKTWPFPSPNWTYDPATLDGGIYFPYQPQPGFQSNTVRYYTPSGSWNLVENTTGLYVRSDGSVELPADPKTDKPLPLVTQTWDGYQRFTAINSLPGRVVPSTMDQYPGSEVYFAGNAFLPGMAGVWSAVKDYTVFDGKSTGTASDQLSYRRPDTWLGLAGDAVAEAMQWADAPVDGNPTEPGGQANKPYIADVSDQLGTYSARVENSNSMMVAELPSLIAGQLFDVSLWVDTGKGFEQVATLGSRWEPWSLSPDGKWVGRPWVDGLGSVVPTITVPKNPSTFPNDLQFAISTSIAKDASGTGTWDSRNRTIDWDTVRAHATGDANELNAYPEFYSLTATTTNPTYKFLLTFTEPAPRAPNPRAGIRPIREATDRLEGSVHALAQALLADPNRSALRFGSREFLQQANSYQLETRALVSSALHNRDLDRTARRDLAHIRSDAKALAAHVRDSAHRLAEPGTGPILARSQLRRLGRVVDRFSNRIDTTADPGGTPARPANRMA